MAEVTRGNYFRAGHLVPLLTGLVWVETGAMVGVLTGDRLGCMSPILVFGMEMPLGCASEENEKAGVVGRQEGWPKREERRR